MVHLPLRMPRSRWDGVEEDPAGCRLPLCRSGSCSVRGPGARPWGPVFAISDRRCARSSCLGSRGWRVATSGVYTRLRSSSERRVAVASTHSRRSGGRGGAPHGWPRDWPNHGFLPATSSSVTRGLPGHGNPISPTTFEMLSMATSRLYRCGRRIPIPSSGRVTASRRTAIVHQRLLHVRSHARLLARSTRSRPSTGTPGARWRGEGSTSSASRPPGQRR